MCFCGSRPSLEILRSVNVWFEAVECKRICSSMQMACVRLVEIVYLNSGLSAGFIVSVGFSSEPLRKPMQIRSVLFLNVCLVDSSD